MVTLVLFVGMRSLIASSEGILEEPPKRRSIDFIRVINDSDPKTKQRQLPKKTPPKPPPPQLKMDSDDTTDPGAIAVSVGPASIESDISLNQISMTQASDGEAVPIVRIEPMYPRRAADQFIEGWVTLQFNITETGATDKVRVIDAEPKRIFDRAAVQAVKKWKYNPKIVDGQPQVQLNQKVRLTFKLD